jgi:Transglycosylase SLT domain
MLKSKMPVIMCSAAFSLAIFSATDKRVLLPIPAESNAINSAAIAVSSLPNRATYSAVAAPGKRAMVFVRHYIRNNNQSLQFVRERSEVPFTIIDSVFNRYGLPHQLKYLAVIESDLKSSAISRVGAKGPWQLMPGTARVLGLKVNSTVDERMDYYKSTKAAARYLRDLYKQFGDWMLVLAAYNGGPGPVFRAMHESHSKSFWVLQRYLPAESREHVKKFMATNFYFEGQARKTNTSIPQPMAPNDHSKDLAKQRLESSDEKFSRLMSESARSLQKANEMLARMN